MANDADAASGFLADGADVDAADRSGFTPLHLAAQGGSLEAARVLLEAGADVNIANRYGNTPLFVAVFNSRGSGAMIALLRAWGADPGRENGSGQQRSASRV